jgi:N-carbamoylputrescine amidase
MMYQPPINCCGDSMTVMRIGLLHLEPLVGEVAHNRGLIEHGIEVAASEGVRWVITPELCVTGYDFTKLIGTDWILPQPDDWMASIQRLAKDNEMTIFLSHPERVCHPVPLDAGPVEEDRLYNSIFVIGPQGEVLGVHRKIKPTGGAEAWSVAGREPAVVDCGGVKVGLLICADAWFPEIVQDLKKKGAEILVSGAAWPPGLCGPDDTWELRTAETGLPIWVCNRTGNEQGINLDYRNAESVVAQGGNRLLAKSVDRSTLIYFDWDMGAMTLCSQPAIRPI